MRREDLLCDFKLAQTDIFEWKVHIVRSINREAAKQDQLKTISTYPNCTCTGNNGLGNEFTSA